MCIMCKKSATFLGSELSSLPSLVSLRTVRTVKTKPKIQMATNTFCPETFSLSLDNKNL